MKLRLPYLLIAPALLLMTFWTFYPFIYLYYLSLSRWNIGDPEPVFIGLGNFEKLFFHDPRFLNSVAVTAAFTFLSVVISMFIGFGLALVLNKSLRGFGLARTLFLLPMSMTPIVTSLVWRQLWTPPWSWINFFLNQLTFGAFPLESEWLFNPDLALITVVITDAWQWTPFVILALLAGFQSLPREPYEAALVDGASKVQILRYVTLPAMSTLILIVLIFRTVWAIRSFDIIFAMTNGGPGTVTENLPIWIFKQMMEFYKIGYSAAVAVVTFIVILAITMILVKLVRRTFREEV